jgi:hypothetical protein
VSYSVVQEIPSSLEPESFLPYSQKSAKGHIVKGLYSVHIITLNSFIIYFIIIFLSALIIILNLKFDSFSRHSFKLSFGAF